MVCKIQENYNHENKVQQLGVLLQYRISEHFLQLCNHEIAFR